MTTPTRSTASPSWFVGQIATEKRFIPNVPVLTHLGDQTLFYDDLIKDRIVIVQFMTVSHHRDYPVTNNLCNVQRLLGSRLGREVHVISITADPEHDTVERLAKFANRFNPREGWTFLTGGFETLEAIRNVFFFHGGVPGTADPAHPGHHAHDRDCSMGLLRYGNDAAGLWGSVPTKTDPKMIVERLSWVQPSAKRAGRLVRRGPKRLV